MQPCPSGTYNPRPGIHNVTECTQCDGGTYCLTPGLSAPSGNCSAGYYCRYGDFSVSVYIVLILQGTLILEGNVHVCMLLPVLRCPLFVLCSGVNTATPNGANTGEGNDCPLGHYCPEATTEPITCPSGTYR